MRRKLAVSKVSQTLSYPLSALQEGMVFHTLKHPGSMVYSQQLIGTIYEALDVSAFTGALSRILKRYPNLRVHIRFSVDGAPVQVLNKTVTLSIKRRNWGRLTKKRQTEKFEEFLRTDRQQGFDLQQPPLMRCTLFCFGDAHFKFVWTSHHLLFDGRSRVLLLKELCALYQATSKGSDLELPAPTPYWTFINWLESQNFDEHEHAWRETLTGLEAPTPLVIDLPQTLPHGQEEVKTHTLSCPETLTTQLRHLSQKTETTLNSLLVSTWALILSRYSGQTDVVFGVTRTGRSCPVDGIENIVGLCINTLPMRVTIPQDMHISDWLKKIRAQWVALYGLDHTPLASIQGWSELAQGEPLFESLVVFEHRTLNSTLRSQYKNWPNWNFHVEGMTNYPLVISGHGDSHFRIDFTYHGHRFSSESIERIAGHFYEGLKALVANPQQTLAAISLLSPQEHQQIVVDWNRTQSEYPKDRCIHELVEDHVLQTPEAIAAVYEDAQLTYEDLNRRADHVANYLRQYRIGPETLVGVSFQRSLEMIIAILGILKAGAGYLPLDLNTPTERLDWVVKDSKVRAVLGEQDFGDRHPTFDSQDGPAPFPGWSMALLQIANKPGALSDPALTVGVAYPQNLAYTMYTSGSTGTPKGVVISHQAIVNHTNAINSQYQIRPSDRVLQFAGLSFDVATEELFPSLANGATVVLRSEHALISVSNFLHFVTQHQITLLNLPASYWQEWITEVGQGSLARPPTVRLVVVGSEKVLSENLATWKTTIGPHVEWCNAFGVTEATITTTIYDANQMRDKLTRDSVPIGRPIANSQVYLLDHHLQPVPIGVIGELYIAGVGLARGYKSRAEQTAERFLPNPLSTAIGEPFYKTGDLARYLYDGQLEYGGRTDHQVKLRGYRIELGEIEAVLRTHPQIQETVVLACEYGTGDKQLVAYVVISAGPKPSAIELRRFLDDRLPKYMVPATFMILDQLPRTSNGKINRHVLPAPDGYRPDIQYHGPETQLEERIATDSPPRKSWHP